MLGHEDASMTLNVYASPFEDDLDAVSNRLDAAWLDASAACGRSRYLVSVDRPWPNQV